MPFCIEWLSLSCTMTDECKDTEIPILKLYAVKYLIDTLCKMILTILYCADILIILDKCFPLFFAEVSLDFSLDKLSRLSFSITFSRPNYLWQYSRFISEKKLYFLTYIAISETYMILLMCRKLVISSRRIAVITKLLKNNHNGK